MEFGTELMIMNEAFVEPFHWPSFYWYNIVVNKYHVKDPRPNVAWGLLDLLL